MNSSSQIVCFGELLIDMISANNGSLVQSQGFLKKFGGAPANTAVGLAKLDVPVSFIGKVGNDPFGIFLKQTLDDNKVDTTRLILSNSEKTTLAFVSLTKTGGRDFFFYKGAHETISPQEVNLPNNTFLFHFGSLTQTNETAKRATEKLLIQARKKKAIVSYDPNIREHLWGDLDRARNVVLETVKKVDILKLNKEEALFLAKAKTLDEAAKKLFTNNLDALFITLGKDGCYFKTKNDQGFIKTDLKVKAIDTTGAGDAFNAGYIYSLYKTREKPSRMSKGEMLSMLKLANNIAALTTTRKGAIDAFPDKENISSLTNT